MNDTENRLRTVIAKHLGIEAEKVTADANIADDLGADSLDVVELVLEVEDEFKVSITDDQAEKIVTVGDFVPLIEAKPEVAGA